MNSDTLKANLIRFVLFVLIQGFILKGINLKYIDIFLYPLFIIMLPIGMVDGLLLLVCFMIGLSVDAFYNTFGLFASAAVFTGAVRQIVLMILEPRGGYETGKAVTRANLGTSWFFQYASIVLLFHSFWVAMLEDLAFSWIGLLRILLLTMFSVLIAMMYQFIFNPKV